MFEIVGIALSVQRRGYGVGIRVTVVRFPAGTETWGGTSPASFSMGTGGSFPKHKSDGAWSWTLPLNAKNEWIFTSAPHMPSWPTQDNFSFFFSLSTQYTSKIRTGGAVNIAVLNTTDGRREPDLPKKWQTVQSLVIFHALVGLIYDIQADPRVRGLPRPEKIWKFGKLST